MTIPSLQTVAAVLACFVAVLAGIGIANYILVRTSGTPVPAPDIPRGVETFGASGDTLTYTVLGDSTAIAQGADYDDGYARATARHLAEQAGGHTVRMHNLGVSGARAADVARQQAPAAAKLKPDVALVAVGANDVTHVTSIGSIRESLVSTIDQLRSANQNVRIIVTGSPQMGSVARFPQPMKQLARLRSDQVNRMVEPLAKQQGVTFAPIAARTGPAFNAHPEYYAADNFHPNAAGYKLWTAVLNDSLDEALKNNTLD